MNTINDGNHTTAPPGGQQADVAAPFTGVEETTKPGYTAWFQAGGGVALDITRELKVAYGDCARSKFWENAVTDWEELSVALSCTQRTNETQAEYMAMSSDEKERVKDRGGFVGGHLRNGRRRVGDVECRSIVALDVDDAEPGFIERFARECRHAAVLYTTHGHRPEAPRMRIIMPLAEDISPDRYAAVARYYAALWGIDQFDPCSFRVNQLMYWPTTSKDGEYIYKVLDGPFFDADEFLADYPDWRDCSKLPIAKKEKPPRETNGKKLEDPLTKSGTVGAMCRAYTAQAGIQEYLSDVYRPSEREGRYDYIPGEGSAGVVIYDDKYIYSHHATDPAGGRLLNIFDAIRLHRFPDDDEKTSFVKMCGLAESDELVQKELERERQEQAKAEFKEVNSSWEEPIPFGECDLAPFPTDALPPDICAFAEAAAESTQTPVDMAGTAALAVIAMCCQGKYVIRGKPDWTEPVNIYANVIAQPSERKSAVLHLIIRPADNYEVQYNVRIAAAVEASKMRKRILERRQKAIEEKVAKGQAEQGEMDQIAQEIANFVEEKPLQLYVDDITTEKLVSVMAGNRGRAALISSEGGIFDLLSGTYSKYVNIDVFLKAYSGDTIRTDRIGRESETIMNPALTMLLMTQPKVAANVLGNATFRGRGLTARYLYSLPVSSVGERQFESRPIPDEVSQQYEQKIIDMLEDEWKSTPEVITLDADASRLLKDFSDEVEAKLTTEYAEIADWAGKLVGNTLRIAGLLCRASVCRAEEFLFENSPLVVSGETMANAIRLGRYYLSHAMAVHDVIPEGLMYRQADKVLKMIRDKKLTEFDRRTAMRNCRTFKTVAEIQPVLDFLDDMGYIAAVETASGYGKGRPPLPKYVVNPAVLS